MLKNISIFLCTVMIGFAGCATSNQNATLTKADYDTGTIPAKFELDSFSFLDDANVLYRIQVYTDKESERPDIAKLIFQLRPGPDKYYLRSRSLSITADGKTFEWPGREWINIYESPPVRGRISSGILSYSNLVEIAHAKTVKGSLGGQDFDWPYKDREHMRKFIAKVRSNSLE